MLQYGNNRGMSPYGLDHILHGAFLPHCVDFNKSSLKKKQKNISNGHLWVLRPKLFSYSIKISPLPAALLFFSIATLFM